MPDTKPVFPALCCQDYAMEAMSFIARQPEGSTMEAWQDAAREEHLFENHRCPDATILKLLGRSDEAALKIIRCDIFAEAIRDRILHGPWNDVEQITPESFLEAMAEHASQHGCHR